MRKSEYKIGVLGVGHLIQHLLPGLLRGTEASALLLSPRNAARTASLRERFGCAVADSNAGIIERCETVLVAVRPGQLEGAIADLPWRSTQTVVSFCAGVPISVFARHVNGAAVVRALPVTAAEFGESPTCLYPADAGVEGLLSPCGPVLVLSSENHFEVASVMGAYYGWLQALVGETADWLSGAGLDPDTARHLAAAMTRAGATTVLERHDTPIRQLVEELCPPGSITRRGRDSLLNDKAFAPWHQACATVLEKLTASN